MTYDPMSSDFYSETNNGEKDNTIPRFYIRPVKNEFKSNEAGRAIFEDREYVEIIIPGNRGTMVDAPVREEHKMRWPQRYAAFKAGAEQATEGTPIEEWAAITRSQAEELKHVNVRTVEILANLDDQNLQRAVPMGGHALRDKARRFIEQAQGAAPAEALAAKVEEQADMMAAMKIQMDAMAQELAAAKAKANS